MSEEPGRYDAGNPGLVGFAKKVLQVVLGTYPVKHHRQSEPDKPATFPIDVFIVDGPAAGEKFPAEANRTQETVRTIIWVNAQIKVGSEWRDIQLKYEPSDPNAAKNMDALGLPVYGYFTGLYRQRGSEKLFSWPVA